MDKNKIQNTYVMSDPHYMHKNISGPIVSKWKRGYRIFNNEIEMSKTIINNINDIVKSNDILYCLGDWSFGDKENIINFRYELNCNNIHLCLGNHDDNIKKNKPIKYLNKTIYPNDLFSSVNDTIRLNYNEQLIYMSHYKHAIWRDSHRGSIHLYGHSHSMAEDWVIGKSMDVGIDNAYKLFGEYRPFHMDEIIHIMENRNIFTGDGHV